MQFKNPFRKQEINSADDKQKKFLVYLAKAFPVYTKEILIILSFLSCILFIQLFRQEEVKPISRIEPQPYGNEEKKKFYYKYQDGDQHSIMLEVPLVDPNDKEIEYILHEAQIEFQKSLLNQNIRNNEMLSEVDRPIELPVRIGDCLIEYEIDQSHIMNQEGWFFLDEVKGETSIKIDYRIVLKYGQKEEASLLGSYVFMVDETSFTHEYLDLFGAYQLEEYVKGLDLGDDIAYEGIDMPKDYVFFEKDPKQLTAKNLLLIPIVFSFFSLLAHMEKKLKEDRERSMGKVHLTYIVHSFLLFYQSGMTVYKSLWNALSSRVDLMSQDDPHEKNLKNIIYMMEQSQDFHQVLKNINQCFKIREVYRFTRLIAQNLKLGDSQMENQLEAMSHEMWELRLHHARKESEKASTKLIMPMVLIFIIVLMLTIVPAFMEVETLI